LQIADRIWRDLTGCSSLETDDVKVRAAHQARTQTKTAVFQALNRGDYFFFVGVIWIGTDFSCDILYADL
jgi:hypothetical protein